MLLYRNPWGGEAKALTHREMLCPRGDDLRGDTSARTAAWFQKSAYISKRHRQQLLRVDNRLHFGRAGPSSTRVFVERHPDDGYAMGRRERKLGSSRRFFEIEPDATD